MPPAPNEIYDHVYDRWVERIGQSVKRIRGNASRTIGKLVRLHFVAHAAFHAHPLWWQLRRAARRASRTDKTVLPFLGPKHWRGRGSFGIRSTWGLGWQDLAPFQIIRVGNIALGLDHTPG